MVSSTGILCVLIAVAMYIAATFCEKGSNNERWFIDAAKIVLLIGILFK